MDKIKIKKSNLYIFGIIIIVFIGGFLFFNSSDKSSNGIVSGNLEGDVQNVVISMKNYNYYPNTIKVKAGKGVRISLDESVYGCFRGFTIRDLGINKYLETPEDTVEFTPTKPGRYTFACSMGMGTGTLIVE